MRHVLLRVDGLRTDLDIEKALGAAGLWVVLVGFRYSRSSGTYRPSPSVDAVLLLVEAYGVDVDFGPCGR